MSEIEIKSPYKVKEVLFQRKYPGYIYRRELVDDSDYGGDGNLEMVNCYSSESGNWLGDSKHARMLCKKYKLMNIQKIHKDHSSCSIGFNKEKQKYYGWSHRAIYGFGIGSKCKRGDCSYVPMDKDDFLEASIRFWSDDSHLDINGYHTEKEDEYGKNELGVYVEWTYDNKIPNEKLRGGISGVFMPYPAIYGKGEWEAKTLEDAKQMAIDFAAGVS